MRTMQRAGMCARAYMNVCEYMFSLADADAYRR